MSKAVLKIVDLNIKIGKHFNVVSQLSFTVHQGETVCLVGESGCGKSISALSVLGLLPPVANVDGGRIMLGDQNLLDLNEREMRDIRGNDIAMIFQEPMSSLNPLRTIGFQIAEVMLLHLGLSKSAAWKRAEELLELVHMPAARQRLNEYPHQLSGGMRQRVMIAMSLACEPKVILADEPTTALDVTIQAQITDIMAEMQREFGTAILLITHDMGLVAETADRVVVMYAGRKVEEVQVDEFFRQPTHPYSRGLLASLPRLGGASSGVKRLQEIPGSVPALGELQLGCPFYSRCKFADQSCHETFPPYTEVTEGHFVACWHPSNSED